MFNQAFSRVNLKDLKSFLPRINYKIPTSKLREVFNEVDTKRRAEIGFDDFTLLYQKLLVEENVLINAFFLEVCEMYSFVVEYGGHFR